MTREEKLYSMQGRTLIQLADNLGVKVICNKTRTALKESKDKVIARILDAEKTDKIEEEKEKIKVEDKTQCEEIDSRNNDEWEDNSYEEKKKKAAESDAEAEAAINKKKAISPEKKMRPGKGAQLQYKGRSQNICAWAKELGISANTLYGRIYKMGWSIEKAFETPPRKK